MLESCDLMMEAGRTGRCVCALLGSKLPRTGYLWADMRNSLSQQIAKWLALYRRLPGSADDLPPQSTEILAHYRLKPPQTRQSAVHFVIY